MQPLRILVLSQYDRNGASSRVYLYLFERFFREKGMELDIRPLIGGKHVKALFKRLTEPQKILPWLASLVRLGLLYCRRVSHVLSARKYDAVLLQKDVLPFGLGWVLRRMNRNLILLMDDPIWLNQPAFDGGVLSRMVFRYRLSLFHQRLKEARLVIVDNPNSADYVSARGANVFVLSSPLELKEFCGLRERSTKPLTVGWVGSPSTSYLLEELVPLLETLAADFSFRILNVGGRALKSSILSIENRAWTETSEREALAQMDIGLVPLDLHPYNINKFSLKVALYFSSGVAALVGDTPLNRIQVGENERGLLYQLEDPRDFVEKARMLLRDADLRKRMTTAAYEYASQNFDVEALGPRYVQLVKEAVHGRGTTELRQPLSARAAVS